MIQCFAPSAPQGTFPPGQEPRLVSASKIGSHYTIHPRVLHKHDDLFEILYVRAGTGVYIIEEARYPIRAGDLIYCNAGTLHDEDPSCSVDLDTLCVASTGIRLDGLPPDHLIGNDCPPVLPSGEFSATIQYLMLTIYGFLADDPEKYAAVCQHLDVALLEILLLIAHQYGDGAGGTKRSKANIIAAQVKSYLNAHYDEDFTLQDISDAIHVDPYHLSHVFKEATGYSPKQYTVRRRLGEAQTLLITTRMNITEIASRVGFGNQCHFNTIFKKYIGMTPSQYRASYVDQEGRP